MINSVGLLDQWITGDRSERTIALKQLYELQANFLFKQYEPVKAAPREAGLAFLTRLEQWLSSFDDPSDQWNAYLSLRYFFFAGHLETEEMYRCAVHHKLYPWLVDQASIDIFSADCEEQLAGAVRASWPCPVTDSLRINSLLHRTGLDGKGLRPDWYSLKTLGSREQISKYVAKHGIKYLALFEDFVGSGRQCADATRFALHAFEGPILLCPLVVCEPGDEKLRALVSTSSGRLTYVPVVVITGDCLIRKDPHPSEPKSFPKLRNTLENGYAKIAKSLDGAAYGFSDVGSLYSSYSNCPNNTPPVFHARTKTWPHPLFPRKSRI